MDTLFLFFGKAVWTLIRPETLFLLIFALAVFLGTVGLSRASQRVVQLGLLAGLLVAIFPVADVALDPLEQAYPARPDVSGAQGIIVLGGMEHEGPAHTGGVAQVNDAAERLIEALALSRQVPDASVIFTGGALALRPVEAGTFEIGPSLLRAMGLDPARLVVEGRSRSTAENATFARAIVSETDPGPWVLVTSAWHMPRAVGAFCAAGWENIIPYPVDYRGGAFRDDIGWNLAENLGELNTAAKEWVGLLAYWVSGRSDRLFPTGC